MLETKQRLRVLLVDDDPLLLNALARLLGKHFEVLKAADGAEAKKVVANVVVDLILSDYSMPEMDGLALIQLLRTQGQSAPASLVTAAGECEEIQEARRSGLISSVIAKPWRQAEMLTEALRLVQGAQPTSGAEPSSTAC